MLRFGRPPYIECSSRRGGYARLSAFHAKLRSGRSIETTYQAAKVFRPDDEDFYTWYRLDEASHLCAGLSVGRVTGRVVTAAPVLRWTIGKPFAEIERYCRQKGWRIEKLVRGTVTGLPWREAKGRQALNAAECRKLYSTLWDEYMAYPENRDLVDLILSASGLSDVFGQEGHACQAEELWRIREKCLIDYIINH